MDHQVAISVSPDIIKAHVTAAVQQVLNRDPEKLVKAVVDAAMTQTKDRWDKTTIWEDQLNAAIRAVAEETWKEWLEEQKPVIKRLIRARFEGAKGKETVGQIVEQMTAALTKIHLSVSFRE